MASGRSPGITTLGAYASPVRALGVGYVAGSRPRVVNVSLLWALAASGTAQFLIAGVTVASVSAESSAGVQDGRCFGITVPAGATYRVNATGAPAIAAWTEADYA